MTTLVERECPRCGALVTGSAARVVCEYCGAQLSVVEPLAVEYETHVVHALCVERVGPSNRERIAALLVTHAGLSEAEARERLASLPCTLGEWAEPERAHAVCGLMVDGGADAKVVARVVKTAIPPPADVVLESIGPDLVRTIKTLRQHLTLSLPDAKRLAQSAPCVLAQSMPGPKAIALVEALTAEGAKARLE